jgi:hypothetical protein
MTKQTPLSTLLKYRENFIVDEAVDAENLA